MPASNSPSRARPFPPHTAIAWRLVWPNGSKSGWKEMPTRRLRPSDGKPAIEFAYTSCPHCRHDVAAG